MLGVLLLPFCWAGTRTLVSLIRAAEPAGRSVLSFAVLALGGGFLLWMVLYLALPHPVRSYVLAHELTHALWGSFMGAKVSRVRVSQQSGSVTLSKSNFLIALAPYFFPFYTVIVIIVYFVMSILVNVQAYTLYWLGLVGFTWGFHLTFTASTLLQHQSDIKEYGHLFSYVVIYLMNILGICLWIVVVSPATLEQMVGSLSTNAVLIAGVMRERILALVRQ